jgi:hypothetical protein
MVSVGVARNHEVEMQTFAWCVLMYVLLKLPAEWGFQYRDLLKHRREGGDLLYRERSPWLRFSVGRRVLIVAGALFSLSVSGLMLQTLSGPVPFIIPTLVLALIPPFIAAKLICDACTGFPYSGIELRTGCVLKGSTAYSWDRFEEYCWLDPQLVLRVKVKNWGYFEWRVDPRDRDRIEAIIHEHQVPQRASSWQTHAGAAA